MTARTIPTTASTVALTALTPIAWGSTYAVTTELLPPDRPLFTALVRALPAGLALLAVARTLPRGAWVMRAFALGTLNIGIFFPCLFLAAYRLPGGVAAILGAAAPLFVIAAAPALLSERPSARKLLAGVLGLVGVALVVLRAGAHLDALGIAAGLAGAVSMAIGTVLAKRWGRPPGVGPAAVAGWQLTAGGLVLLPVALLGEGAPPALTGDGLVGYGYLVFLGTAAAYWLWFRGIGRLAATSVGFLILLSPVSAATIGWAVLGEALTPLQLLGMALTLGGTLLGQTHARTPHLPHPSHPPVRPVTSTEPCSEESIPMHITVFGAGGSVGSRVVTEALSRGHDVTAAVRDAARASALPAAVAVRVADAADPDAVAALGAECDVVIAATRPAAGDEPQLVATARALLDGVARSRTRLLLVGGAATLTVPETGGIVLDDPRLIQPPWRAIAEACVEQHAVCRADARADWSYASPPAMLEPGERTGSYRLGGDELVVDADGRSAISIEDFAVALIDEAEQPRHRRTRFTVAR